MDRTLKFKVALLAVFALVASAGAQIAGAPNRILVTPGQRLTTKGTSGVQSKGPIFYTDGLPGATWDARLLYCLTNAAALNGAAGICDMSNEPANTSSATASNGVVAGNGQVVILPPVTLTFGNTFFFNVTGSNSGFLCAQQYTCKVDASNNGSAGTFALVGTSGDFVSGVLMLGGRLNKQTGNEVLMTGLKHSFINNWSQQAGQAAVTLVGCNQCVVTYNVVDQSGSAAILANNSSNATTTAYNLIAYNLTRDANVNVLGNTQGTIGAGCSASNCTANPPTAHLSDGNQFYHNIIRNQVFGSGECNNSNLNFTVTAWSITSNVVTFTGTTPGSGVDHVSVGQVLALSGFGTSTFFNGNNVTVSSATYSAGVATSFTAAFTHANGSGTEAGLASYTPASTDTGCSEGIQTTDPVWYSNIHDNQIYSASKEGIAFSGIGSQVTKNSCDACGLHSFNGQTNGAIAWEKSSAVQASPGYVGDTVIADNTITNSSSTALRYGIQFLFTGGFTYTMQNVNIVHNTIDGLGGAGGLTNGILLNATASSQAVTFKNVRWQGNSIFGSVTTNFNPNSYTHITGVAVPTGNGLNTSTDTAATPNNCVKFDANGQPEGDSGAPCGGSPSLDLVTGAAAQATGTETAAGHNYTFAGVETAALNYPFVFKNTSASNNSSGALIVTTAGAGNAQVPLFVNNLSGGPIQQWWAGATITNGVASGGTKEGSIDSSGNLALNGGLTTGGTSNVCGTASPAFCGTASTNHFTPAAGVHAIQFDSTTESALLSVNGSTGEPIPTLNGSFTAGHALKVNSQLGSGSTYDIADAGYATNAIPFSNLTVTGLNVATILSCSDTSGSGTAQVCNTSPLFTPAANSCINYTTTTANTGTGLTLNVNSLGAKSVAKWQTTTTLAANDIRANTQVKMCYDGTNWEVDTVGNAPSGGSGAPGGVTILKETATYAGASGDFSSATAAPTQVIFTVTATGQTYTLLSTAPASGSCVIVENSLASTPYFIGIITGGSTTLDGTAYTTAASTLGLAPGESSEYCSDGANYFTQAGRAGPNVATANVGQVWIPNIARPTSTANFVISGTANQVVAYQFTLPFRVKASKIGLNVTTLGTSAVCDIGIYDATSAHNLITHAAFTCTSVNQVTPNLATTVVLPPGVYYLAVCSSVNTVAISGYNEAGSIDTVWQDMQTGVEGTAANACSTGVLPATLGTVTNSTGLNGTPLAVIGN